MDRTTIWILGDQLLSMHPALETSPDKAATQIVMIESARQMRRLPYQRKKLVLLISAMRHYAQALRGLGYEVDLIKAESAGVALGEHIARYKPDKLVTMAASSYRGRQFQHNLQGQLGLPVEVLANTQFLVGRYNPIPDPEPGKRYVMEQFYRLIRSHYDLLMDGDEPVGDRWNYDAENRKKLPRDVQPPRRVSFAVDEITQQVMDEVEAMDVGTGTVDGFDLGVTRSQALQALQDFLQNRLPRFGDYEDALTRRSHLVYHSQLSPYLNLGLLEPLEVAKAAEDAYGEGRAPINAVEGFIRQIIGWREFMYWQYWRQMPRMEEKNAWGAERALPSFVWTADTEMACLKYAVSRALDTGYNHHIERLMLLCNFFMLAGVEPRQVNDWFLSLYIDAYEWVMPPNVIGMGLNADGSLTATKPYIASANYINNMGDHCGPCRFNPKERHGANACPYNFLYWNFILEHEERLTENPRTSRNVWGLRHLDDQERHAVKRQAAAFLGSWPDVKE